MTKTDAKVFCESRFAELFGKDAALTALAPGRLEVLGNHTDYNLGVTLSCAVALRCFATISPLIKPEVHMASTAFEAPAEVYPLDNLKLKSWTI